MFSGFNKNYIHSNVYCNLDFEKLEKSAKKYEGCNKQILLSFTGDPYCNFESGETRAVLEVLNKYRHKVAILTKNPTKAIKDIDIFKTFGCRLKIGSTLTFSEVEDSKRWEPGAELPAERVSALSFLAKHGIKTWASFEPVIIPEQSLLMLDNVSSFIDHVKIGKLNNYKGIDKNIDWNKFLSEAVRICRQNNVPFYIKDDLSRFNENTFLNSNEIDQDFLSL